VTATLGGFFRRAQPMPMADAAYLARLRRRIRGNQRALSAALPDLERKLIDEVTNAQLGVLSLIEREVGGRGRCLVDGHGDLRAEHVALGPPVRVIDCLEFDRDLRRLDPAEELAFLVLECRRLGAAPFARALLESYRQQTGDGISDAAFEFYVARRAATRAKIAAWHLRNGRAADHRRWTRRAHACLEEALKSTRHVLGMLRSSGGRPLLQQRRDRPAVQHPPQGLGEKGRNRQHVQRAAG